MKIIYFLVCCASLMLPSCNKDGQTCEELNADLLAVKVDGVKSKLDSWLAELPPDADQDDALGHEDNLESFIQRLESDCSMDVDLVCYACIETHPSQSEISFELDSAGQQVHRVVDIVTPDNDVMTIRDIH